MKSLPPERPHIPSYVHLDLSLQDRTHLCKAEVKTMIEQIMAHDVRLAPDSMRALQSMPCIENSQGRMLTPRQILGNDAEGAALFTCASKGHEALAVKFEQEKVAKVIPEWVFESATSVGNPAYHGDCVIQRTRALERLRRVLGLNGLGRYVHIEDLAAMHQAANRFVAECDLSTSEVLALAAIREVNDKIPEGMKRKIRICQPPSVQAWTDGEHYINLPRQMLASCNSVAGCYWVLVALIHEYAHVKASWVDHQHGPQFYERFHAHTNSQETLLLGSLLYKLANPALVEPVKKRA